MKKVLLFVVFLLLLFAGLTVYLWNGYQTFLKQPLGLTQELTIEKGMSAYKLGRQWQSAGVIEQFYYYQLLLKLKPELRAIKAGNYAVEPEMTAPQVLQKLVEGNVISYQFTIVEGTNIYELLKTLNAVDNIEKRIANETDDFYNTVFPSIDFIDVKKTHPEGMFFADTYQYTRGDSDLDLLQRAYNKLQQVLEEEWNNRADNLPYKTPYEALIMASIIEKETAVPAERPEIAGVFVRRLKKGMLLQTDPTIIYGLIDDPNIDYDGDIRRKDIRNPHPWNTYVHAGLPPTPIAMVGREAIWAALHPKEGDTYYFVAKGDGSHYFSKTLAEHNRAVRTYQLKR